MTTSYSAGTISIAANATAVTGVGTGWLTAGLRAGDMLTARGLSVPILSVNSATSLTLARPWPGAALSGAVYDVIILDDNLRLQVAINALLQGLAGGSLLSLGQLASVANMMPYWTGTGVMGSTALTAFARTLLDDANQDAMRATLGVPASARATIGGSANALTLEMPGLSRVAGAQVVFRATATNTGAVTIALNGGGATGCRTVTGAVLPAGYIRTDVETVARFDGTFWVLDRQPERGLNANGEFTRRADGSQTCLLTGVTVSKLTSRYLLGVSWVFPAAFAKQPVATYSPRNNAGSVIGFTGLDIQQIRAAMGNASANSVGTSSCELVLTFAVDVPDGSQLADGAARAEGYWY